MASHSSKAKHRIHFPKPNPHFGKCHLYSISCLNQISKTSDWSQTLNIQSVNSSCQLKHFLSLKTSQISLPLYSLPEKAMAPHSSTLAWKTPWTEEPGRLQSMGSLRVRHDWATSLSLFTFMHWRRKWQPTPLFLSGESQGWGSLVGCRLWSYTESDTTEAT